MAFQTEPIDRMLSVADMQSRQLRVCTIAYSFYHSDGRVMRYNKALAARGEVVDVVTLREPGRPRISRSAGVTLFGIQNRTVNERSQFAYLLRILLFFVCAMFLVSWRQLRFGYDLVHVHSVPDFLVFTAWLPKLMGAKVILDIHDLLPELYASKFNGSSQTFMFRLLLGVERLSTAFADHVITANDLWQERIAARCRLSEKATAMLNFPDCSVFQPRGRTRRDDKFIMIYPGTLNWHQGLDLAIRAFAKMHTMVPAAEFHIYGAGPALPELKELVHTLGLQRQVRFNRMLPLHEIARVIEDADLGVVPKRKNGFGNEAFSTKTLEFMALGVPVIVSDTRIDTYYFDDSVVRFFRGEDPDDLARAMLELITDGDSREALRRKGREFVRRNSWEAKKHVYLDLVDSLCANHVGVQGTSSYRTGASE